MTEAAATGMVRVTAAAAVAAAVESMEWSTASHRRGRKGGGEKTGAKA